MTEYTAHFRLPIPDFTQEPWHAEFETLCRAIDTMAYEALLANATTWMNSTAYDVGAIVLDDTNGQLYVCAVAHTSPPIPTTFASFRQANPSYWNPTIQLPQQRGTWTTATTYFVGDFVIDNNRYAVCVVSHVSTTFNADLGAGKWSVLIDLSGVNIGINALPEAAIAAGSTVDLGNAAATRIVCSGTGQTITSFGADPELFKFVRFDGVNTVVNNANIILLGGLNFVTSPGDMLLLQSNSGGNWKEISRLNAASEVSRGYVELATDAEATVGTDTIRALTPKSGKAQIDAIFFPSGTRMLFQQTGAPTGWTKDLTHNDKAVRIINGTAGVGGNIAFTTVFGRQATDTYTLVTNDIPSHQHDAFIGQDDHTHPQNTQTATLAGSGAWASAVGSNQGLGGNTQGAKAALKIRSDAHGVMSAAPPAVLDKVGSTGGGGSHSHGMDIRVQYVDFIIAVKN